MSILPFAAAALHAIALTRDGRTAVTASADFHARCYDLTTGQCTATLEGHSGWVTDVKITPSGRTAVTASHDHTARCCLHHKRSDQAESLVITDGSNPFKCSSIQFVSAFLLDI